MMNGNKYSNQSKNKKSRNSVKKALFCKKVSKKRHPQENKSCSNGAFFTKQCLFYRIWQKIQKKKQKKAKKSKKKAEKS